MSVSLVPAPHVELHYWVLSHLDLGPDVASLYRPERAPRPWTDRLLAAYQSSPARLILQVLPLWFADLDSLLAALRSRRAPGLEDASAVCDLFADTLAEELAPFVAGRSAGRHRAGARVAEASAFLQGPLETIRRALWLGAGTSEPPDLALYPVDALTDGDWTHGRSTTMGAASRVAVSLQPPLERVLCQILHEETHLVTDPPIRARFAGVDQQTDPDHADFSLHEELERAAVERGRQLIARHASEYAGVYALWCRRYGLP